MAARSPLSHPQEICLREVLTLFPLRDQTLVLLALHTGFRIHELLSIRVEQVWTRKGVRESLCVERSALKGGKGVRRRRVTSRKVPLHPNAAEAIQGYLGQRSKRGPLDPKGPLFPSLKGGRGLRSISATQASRVIGRILECAGLSSSGEWGTHSLRKTFARRIFEQSGNNIALTRCALGHRSIVTTQRYLGFSEADAAEVISRLQAAGSEKVPDVNLSFTKMQRCEPGKQPPLHFGRQDAPFTHRSGRASYYPRTRPSSFFTLWTLAREILSAWAMTAPVSPDSTRFFKSAFIASVILPRRLRRAVDGVLDAAVLFPRGRPRRLGLFRDAVRTALTKDSTESNP